MSLTYAELSADFDAIEFRRNLVAWIDRFEDEPEAIDECVLWVKRVLTKWPRSVAIMNVLADMKALQCPGDKQVADCLKAVLKHDPFDARALESIGHLCDVNGEVEEASRFFAAAVEAKLTFERCLYLAEALYELNDNEGAEFNISRAKGLLKRHQSQLRQLVARQQRVIGK